MADRNWQQALAVKTARAEGRVIQGSTTQLERALRAVVNLIERPEAFCMGALARNTRHMECSPNASSARQWDALGAIEKIAPEFRLQMRQALAQAIGCKETRGLAASFCVAFYGDTFGHAVTLAALRRAIGIVTRGELEGL
jgi:hypothetical protein